MTVGQIKFEQLINEDIEALLNSNLEEFIKAHIISILKKTSMIYYDELPRLKAENESLKAQLKEHEWVSVNEKLPNEYENVIVLIQKFGKIYPYIRIGWIDSESGKWMIYCETGEHVFEESVASTVDYYEITHWQSLPKPPEK